LKQSPSPREPAGMHSEPTPTIAEARVDGAASQTPAWVDTKGASAYSSLGKTTLWKLRNEKLIESAKVGKKVLIFLPSLDDYLHEQARLGPTSGS